MSWFNRGKSREEEGRTDVAANGNVIDPWKVQVGSIAQIDFDGRTRETIDGKNSFYKWKSSETEPGAGVGAAAWKDDRMFDHPHDDFEILLVARIAFLAFVTFIVYMIWKTCMTPEKRSSRENVGRVIAVGGRESSRQRGFRAGVTTAPPSCNIRLGRNYNVETSFNGCNARVSSFGISSSTPSIEFPSAPPLTPPREVAFEEHEVVSIWEQDNDNKHDDPPPPYPGIEESSRESLP